MAEKIRIRKITEEDVADLTPHVGDTIGKDLRMDLHLEAVALHDQNKNVKDDPGFSNQMISGEKGVGKSNMMSMLAVDYYIRGFEVVSNMSLLFGWHIESAVDIMTFARVLPGRIVLVLDEIHLLLSRFRQSSTGQIEFIGGGIASLRKNRQHLLSGTSLEEEVANNFLKELDYIYYPKRRKRIPQMGAGVGHYPSWCHLRVEAVGPRPMEGQTIGERYGIKKGRKRAGRKKVNGFSPKHIYHAAALQSSFAVLPRGKASGQHVMAGDMRDAMASANVLEFDRVEEEYLDEPTEDTKIAWAELIERDKQLLTELWAGMRRSGVAGQKEVSMKYLMFQLALRGGELDEENKPTGLELDQDEVEDMLQRWIQYQPSKGNVDVHAIQAQFGPVRP